MRFNNVNILLGFLVQIHFMLALKKKKVPKWFQYILCKRKTAETMPKPDLENGKSIVENRQHELWKIYEKWSKRINTVISIVSIFSSQGMTHTMTHSTLTHGMAHRL